ncbi:uncharacterized protein LOC131824505 [Mustela lutreola]|uniref:uncharacterized protein LOC131824505 n=1 Tax=Mustela lutreola TaxID=9666 RepID=UPI002797BF8C|nr:uncharacterized protein LOC131824505 [Mustela lutreola]
MALQPDPNLPRQGRQADWGKQPPRPTCPGARGAALPPPNPHADPGSARTGTVRLPARGESSSTLRPSRETAAAAAAALGKAGMILRGRGGGRGGSDCMWGCTGGRRRRSGGSAFFTIIIIIISFYLWRRKAPQLLLPESSSSSPPLSLSLPQSLPGARGTSRARPDQKENRAGGGGGGGDQRPRDHARVTAAASCRAPSPRSTSNNPAAQAPRTLVRRRPPSLEAARARNALALGAQSMGPREARRGE